MAFIRCVTEMGMGVDVHGLDYTAAAKRAVFDAIHHSSLGFPRLVGKTADDMRVEVTIGVPKPRRWIARPCWKRCPTAAGTSTSSTVDCRYSMKRATMVG